MAGTAQKKKSAAAKGSLPVKRSINFAAVGERKANYRLALPLIILFILASVLVVKFAVIDRFAAVRRMENDVQELQNQVDDGYRRIDSFSELNENYAHYTLSDMTEEELTRADRLQVIDLINNTVLPNAKVEGWSISGNRLDLPITGTSLQQINLLAQQLEADPCVDFCVVTAVAADKADSEEEEISAVTAQVTVYLVAAEGSETDEKQSS